MSDIKNNEMIPIPLPTEVPPPPKLENIPTEILHSATVEMLIQQNEDLSSRLKVNLRRNSQLEQRIIDYDKQISDLNRQRDNVLAQIDIVKEKEKIWSNQKENQLKQHESLQKESELLELRYNELYSSTQQQTQSHRQELIDSQKKLRKLEQKIKIYHRIRTRSKDKLRQLLLKLAKNLHLSQSRLNQSENTNRILKKHFSELQKDVSEKEQLFKEQLQNLKTTSKQQLLEMDHRLTQVNERSQQFQIDRETLESELEQIQIQLHEEKKNRIQLQEVSKELSEKRNEIVKMRRENKDLVEKNQETHEQQRQEIKDLKQALNKEKQAQEIGTQTIQTCEKKILELSRDNKELSTQLNALQNLWMESQEKLEKEELRSQALEKINRELSRDKKDERIEKAVQTSTTPAPKTDDLQEKIQTVFASQYRTIAKRPDMDL